jgi:tetratricopeptide (TPR) repeat protein
MLASVREYAAERLEERGDAAARRRLHAEHYAALAEAAEPEPGGNRDAAFPRLAEEHDNLRTAIAWSGRAGAVELELRLVGALAFFWAHRDHLREGRRHVETALSHADGAPPALRAKLLDGGARLAHSLGEYAQMRAYAQECLDVNRSLGDRRKEASNLTRLGIAYANLGELDRGVELTEQGTAIFRELGDGFGLAVGLGNLGNLLLRRGEHTRAREAAGEARASFERLGYRVGVMVTLSNIGLAVLFEGRPDEALGVFRDGLRLAHELGNSEGVIYALVSAAAALAALGGAEEAATLLGAAQAAAEATAVVLEPLDEELRVRVTGDLRETLGDARFDEVYAAGQRLPLDHALALALDAPAPVAISDS